MLDLAEAHVLALEALMRGVEKAPAYNIGAGERGYSIREVLQAAEKVTGRSIPVVMGPRRPGDPATLVASCDKIRNDLGFSAKYQSLEKIIDSAWQWMIKTGRA